MKAPAIALSVLLVLGGPTSLPADSPALTLERLVDPTTEFTTDGGLVPFALNFFIEFTDLEQLFRYIDEQVGRWQFDSEPARRDFADDLLRRGLESRVISMVYETPREVLVTHTRTELAQAIGRLPAAKAGSVFRGDHWSLDVATYRSAFLALQERWKSAINCWSASPSIAGRVLSNWYIIDEGIALFGAEYDSTEHFWQAVKFHPETRTDDLLEILSLLRAIDWMNWIEALSRDQGLYLEHGYSVEFLRHNLSAEKLAWFEREVRRHGARFDLTVREMQQRDPAGLRFSALEEKIIWGDLADVFHLLFFFSEFEGGRLRSAAMEPVLEAIPRHRFDAVYLDGYATGRVGFISPEFQRLMLEIWKVKFLELSRFGEVLRSTRGQRLLHFLNDGTSPDIPIPVYVEMLNEIRELAFAHHAEHSTAS